MFTCHGFLFLPGFSFFLWRGKCQLNDFFFSNSCAHYSTHKSIWESQRYIDFDTLHFHLLRKAPVKKWLNFECLEEGWEGVKSEYKVSKELFEEHLKIYCLDSFQERCGEPTTNLLRKGRREGCGGGGLRGGGWDCQGGFPKIQR